MRIRMSKGSEESGEDISVAIKETFHAARQDRKFFPVFEKVFGRTVKQIVEEQGVNPVLHPEALCDPDEPGDGTWREFLSQKSIGLIEVYRQELESGHSKDYAEACMDAMFDNPDGLNQARAEAYLGMSPSDEASMNNPKYAEAFLWALKNGKSETWAAFFSREVAECDLIGGISVLIDRAQLYSEAIEDCHRRNFSPVYAHAYAKKLVGDAIGETNEHYSHLYAKFYEQMLAEGFQHEKAASTADIYIDAHCRGSEFLEEMNVWEVLEYIKERHDSPSSTLKRRASRECE